MLVTLDQNQVRFVSHLYMIALRNAPASTNALIEHFATEAERRGNKEDAEAFAAYIEALCGYGPGVLDMEDGE